MSQTTATRKRAMGLPADALAAIERANTVHGSGTVIRGDMVPKCNHIPTGSFMLDFALLGGFPQAFPSVVYGKESCGKSTLLLKGMAQYQTKMPDKIIGLIDSEGLYDPAWAAQLGVDTSRVMMAQPIRGEEAVDLFEDWIQIQSLGVIVLDSIPGCVPMNVLDKSAEDNTMTELARLMGKLCQKWIGVGNAEKRKGHFVTPWFTNQFRQKIGIMARGYSLPGGRQINHIPTTKIRLHVSETKVGKDKMGIECPEYDEQEFTLEKTKHGSSVKHGAFQLVLNPDNEKGLPLGAYDNIHQIVTYAKTMGFVTGGGASWKLHTLPEDLRGQKFGNLKSIEEFLNTDPVERDTLWRSVIAHQRKAKKLPALPPDGYLVSPLGRLVELS